MEQQRKRRARQGISDKGRLRERVLREIDSAVFSVLAKYDIEDIEINKPESERTLLDLFIEEYKQQTEYVRSLDSVHRVRGE